MAASRKGAVKARQVEEEPEGQDGPTGPEEIETGLVARKGGKGQREVTKIEVPEFEDKVLKVKIFGNSIITNAWGNKIRQQMLYDQMHPEEKAGKKKKRAPKNPEENFQNARYLDEKGRDCVPAVAVKNAMVTAGMRYYGYSQPLLRGTITVLGDTLPLKYRKMTMREDMVRVGPWGNRQPDIRHRPEYHDWSLDLAIRYDEEFIKPKSLVNLLRRAGFSVGLHEWRIEKGGQFGGFRVDSKIQVVPYEEAA
jgi:hypothetical protein